MGQTPKYTLRYPEPTEPVARGADNMKALAQDTEAALDLVALTDTGWVDVVPRAGFGHQGSNKAQVRRIGKVVYTRWGFSNSGITTINTNYAVADIPAGFRPARSTYFRAGTAAGAQAAQMMVETDGRVEVRTGGVLSSYYMFPSASWLID